MRLADKLRVQFAFPTHTLHMFQESNATSSPPNITDPHETGQRHAQTIAGALLDEKHRPGPVEFPGVKDVDRGSMDDDG